MVVEEARNFPSIADDETRAARPPQHKAIPDVAGNPETGKQLAYSRSKGRCLSCHVLGPDSTQPGNVGPNLSDYGNSKRTREYTFQHIWDARVHNPQSLMPPFGTNELLNAHQVVHITAYLATLTRPVAEPSRTTSPRRSRREKVFIAGVDLTDADDYIKAGKAEFHQMGNNSRSCASCHSAGKDGPDLEGVAATYPKFDADTGRIVAIQDRINRCRDTHMDSAPLKRGSARLNVLTSYIKYLSRDVPIQVATNGPAVRAVERGEQRFRRKAGQLNFSCADCHTQTKGQWLRGQPLNSLDNTAGDWPKHFIAGHDLGLISLQQRIRHCQIVTRTFPLDLGSQEYTEMELYLTALANGEPMLAPTKSRLRGQ